MYGNVVATMRRVAASDVPVLIEGKPGAARNWPHGDPRRLRPPRAPVIVVNCGGRSRPNYMRKRVFGHEKGAFTGATAQRKGSVRGSQTAER